MTAETFTIVVGAVSGTLGGIIGGLSAMFAAKLQGDASLRAAQESNRTTLEVSRENNETSLKAIGLSADNNHKAEYSRRRRDKLEDIADRLVEIHEKRTGAHAGIASSETKS